MRVVLVFLYSLISLGFSLFCLGDEVDELESVCKYINDGLERQMSLVDYNQYSRFGVEVQPEFIVDNWINSPINGETIDGRIVQRAQKYQFVDLTGDGISELVLKSYVQAGSAGESAFVEIIPGVGKDLDIDPIPLSVLKKSKIYSYRGSWLKKKSDDWGVGYFQYFIFNYKSKNYSLFAFHTGDGISYGTNRFVVANLDHDFLFSEVCYFE